MKTIYCVVAFAFAAIAGGALAQPAATQKPVMNTQCTAGVKFCYCVDDAFLPLIDEKVKSLRALIAAERVKGKAIGYLSVPLSTRAGGYFNLNAEISAAAKERIEARLGKEHAWVLNPAMKDAELNLPNGTGGGHGEYMLMWTRVMEGASGMGEDFDFVHFAGPTDFGAFFGLNGTNDMGAIAKYFDDRLAKDASLKREIERGRITPFSFRTYYTLRASVSFSAGAHDEWNIVKALNDKRRADAKFGVPLQMPVFFDGRAVSSGEYENPIAAGSPGACKAP